jgi:hypothetical protein
MCKGRCPTTVTQRMHFHPDSVLPLVQLECPRTAWNLKVPMMGASAPSQFALASNDNSAPAALLEDFPCREIEIELKHA